MTPEQRQAALRLADELKSEAESRTRAYGLEYPLLNSAAALLRELAAEPVQEPAASVINLYAELLYAVGNKHPGETRHQTALRYIRQAEVPSVSAAQAIGEQR